MSLSEYLEPIHPTLCVDCANFAGGCPWTAATGDGLRTQFQAVPGWTAQPSTVWEGGYHVLACPLYRAEKPREFTREWEESYYSAACCQDCGRKSRCQEKRMVCSEREKMEESP